MKIAGRSLSYLIPLGLVFALCWWLFNRQQPYGTIVATAQSAQPSDTAAAHPLAIFILQIIVIIAVSQLCSFLMKRIHQPAVMGEIIAGILLGPSLLGAVAPGVSASLFPSASMGNLQILSQVGLILFMFVIGMELDMDMLRKKAPSALLISFYSIIIPFGLGVVLATQLYSSFAPAGIPFYAFALFTGIAMSITAFPVLARIIRERGLSATRLGTIALTAAAAGDIAAWCMLAMIVAVVHAGSVASSLYTIGETAAFLAVMVFAVRPALRKLSVMSSHDKTIKRSVLAIIFIVLLGSSYCCEVIGIHALFGAFLAGVIMPANWNFRTVLIGKIEDIALVLLLPLFFVYTGLRTQIGLLNDATLWLTCAGIIVAAVAGKFGGSFLAARIAGEQRKDSLSIASLMNTRGLVELVVLNIGYDMHIITSRLFAMMVIMAIATTLMTNPLLNLINRVHKQD